MTHVTCRLTAKNWDRLRNRTLGNRLRATFNRFLLGYEKCGYLEKDRAAASRSVPVDTVASSGSAGRETVSERERERRSARPRLSASIDGATATAEQSVRVSDDRRRDAQARRWLLLLLLLPPTPARLQHPVSSIPAPAVRRPHDTV